MITTCGTPASIGTAACRLWLHYLFDQYSDLLHIGFTTWSDNERMMKLGEKLGMQKEDQIRYW
ncbi:GNAT family N-acetyltransferase [Enterococcus sp. 2201sp1_2201st1_B8_2201SCRN_220225]|uniref:GNAT family N-acetyltransferase n=1 Tax=unclassified Enterococcus TaxID=2608891 RepID=UPI0034A2CDB9